jgi:TetR/AcrR family transcriptional regulator, biofilm operon repressor
MERTIRMPRIPQQKRSIEKKERLIEAAFEAFGRDGYTGTSTPQIAHEAKISTGSLYAYFEDKKALFMECLKIHSERVQEKLLNSYQLTEKATALDVVEWTINTLVEIDGISQPFMRQVKALVNLDEDVKRYFEEQRQRVIDFLVDRLVESHIIVRYEREKVFIVASLIETVSSEIAFNPKRGLDRAKLTELSKAIVVSFGGLEKLK